MPSTPKEPPPSTQVARVTSRALELGDIADTDAFNNNKVDKKILDRIQKCLNRAHHSNTTEAEAKAALRMCSRLMAQFNVTQTEVLAAADTSEKSAQLAGQSVVQITSMKVDGRVINQTWVHDVVSATRIFFDCKSYSTTRSKSIEWTFYGIAKNTVAAAMSFEMVHNLIQDWAQSKKGISTKNSYCLGVGYGLYRSAKDEKQREEEEARKKEQAVLQARVDQEEKMRQSEIERLKATVENDFEEKASSDDSRSASPASYLSWDEPLSDTETFGEDDTYMDDDDEMLTTFKEEDEEPLNPFDDFEAQLRSITNQQSSGIKTSGEEKIENELIQNQFSAANGVDEPNNFDEDSQLVETWMSSSALILFRQKSNNIAEEYLRSKNLKLGKDRIRKRSVRDCNAYRQGQKDSSKIDVKRRRIENGT